MELTQMEDELLDEINGELAEYCRLLENAKLRDAVRSILSISRLGNQYMQANTPWVLVKGSPEDRFVSSILNGPTITVPMKCTYSRFSLGIVRRQFWAWLRIFVV